MSAVREYPFSQVDVFGAWGLPGNPVAVVHDADDLTTEQMLRFASWTNLSETTFLCRPTDPAADYRVRIFTPAVELPFAGHPTLGSAHAWLRRGGTPAAPGVVAQECGVGVVPVRTADTDLAFAAPPLRRYEDVDDATRERVSPRSPSTPAGCGRCAGSTTGRDGSASCSTPRTPCWDSGPSPGRWPASR